MTQNFDLAYLSLLVKDMREFCFIDIRCAKFYWLCAVWEFEFDWLNDVIDMPRHLAQPKTLVVSDLVEVVREWPVALGCWTSCLGGYKLCFPDSWVELEKLWNISDAALCYGQLVLAIARCLGLSQDKGALVVFFGWHCAFKVDRFFNKLKQGFYPFELTFRNFW